MIAPVVFVVSVTRHTDIQSESKAEHYDRLVPSPPPIADPRGRPRGLWKHLTGPFVKYGKFRKPLAPLPFRSDVMRRRESVFLLVICTVLTV